MALVLLLSVSLPVFGFSTRTESWKEDALLHDGRTVKVNREVSWTFQFFAGDGGSPRLFVSWPDRFWLKFEHPDTHETVKWQGEQYFSPVMLDIVDGTPYLVVSGRPDRDTERIYGCPELPYIYLKYEKGLWGKWVPIPAEQAPSVLHDANLSPSYPDFPNRSDEYSETMHKIYTGRSAWDLSRDQVLWNLHKVEDSSGGYFQAKIPRSYDDWYSVDNNDSRKERRRNDCRPPLVRSSPSPEFEAARQRISEAGLKAATVNATIESFVETPEIITVEGFAGSKGVWTGHGYLSNRCDGIVKTIEPIREYFDNGGWHLTGSQIVLNSREKIPFQQSKLSKFQAPAIPQHVTCGNNVIYAVSRISKEDLLIHRFAYSGEVLDALRITLPDADKVIARKEWGDLWEVMPLKERLSIVLADYTYTSTANLGGTITKKQTYTVTLPALRRPQINVFGSTAASQAVPQYAVRSFRDCPFCPEMVAIPGKNYAIGKYEVTQAEWKSVMESDNLEARHNLKGDSNPAIFMGWGGTQRFIARLNQITGKAYRLPTETEWEHACYGGKRTKYCGGDDVETIAWYKGNSWLKLRPVGQKQPNGYGLYDMGGNVWEWMDDCWKDNCDLRIVRGGSFNYYPLQVQDAYIYGKTGGGEDIGFRLARTLP
jgi:hypothetical protein